METIAHFNGVRKPVPHRDTFDTLLRRQKSRTDAGIRDSRIPRPKNCLALVPQLHHPGTAGASSPVESERIGTIWDEYFLRAGPGTWRRFFDR